MRKDVHNKLKKYTREEHCLLNKSELARRVNCDSRTVDRYMKINSKKLQPKISSKIYNSLIDSYKSTIIEKVDNYSATAMAVYKFIEKKGYAGF